MWGIREETNLQSAKYPRVVNASHQTVTLSRDKTNKKKVGEGKKKKRLKTGGGR